jgi:GLPGLI family protein
MKKILATMMTLALTIAAQGQVETVDTAQFVAVYDYECRTQNDEGQDVTDRMQVVVQVGRKVTKSMPRSAYQSTETKSMDDIAADYQEAYMHIPTVWTGYPEGQTTVREYILPQLFEGHEPTPAIEWMLSEDTLTVGGYLCRQATATYRGVRWQVCYTEEIPSSAGPWRLRGLPGLIVEAKSEAHTFRLAKLQPTPTPITAPEQRPDVQRTDYAKMLRHKNRLFGNKQYPKNPLYYVNFQTDISHMEVIKRNDQQYLFANGYPLLTKAHVYQPLEKELTP